MKKEEKEKQLQPDQHFSVLTATWARIALFPPLLSAVERLATTLSFSYEVKRLGKDRGTSLSDFQDLLEQRLKLRLLPPLLPLMIQLGQLPKRSGIR